MNIVELIQKKRNGFSLSGNEFDFLLSGYIRGDVPEYQMSAFLMACYFRGMSSDETFLFTQHMLHSGTVMDLSDIPGLKVDKHSTGGVGDKVSLLCAPMAAACGVPVPMISGRGLGHTGGTLDKLESIPGFRTNLSLADYKRVLRDVGAVLIGQTSEIAPADKKMYALRDVTATVECIPLIAGSIMSKKLAEGIDALVLDIKTGRGAFMQTHERAVELAKTLVDIGSQSGVRTIGFITSMDQPLGVAIGNWLEVVEAVQCLRGEIGTNDLSSDLMEVSLTLSGAMLFLGKKAHSLEEGIEKCTKTIRDGTAYQKFLEIVQAQGGSRDAIENIVQSPVPKFSLEVKSSENGYISTIDAFELGMTSVSLGAGRQTINDSIDPKAGIILKKKAGSPAAPGEPLAVFYTDREEILPEARERIAAAFVISQSPPKQKPVILDRVEKDGIQKRE